MARWIIISLVGVLAITSVSQAEYDVPLDDFTTDTMVDHTISGSTGNYQYQHIDTNWGASYGNSSPPPGWRINEDTGVLEVIVPSQTIRVGRIFNVDFTGDANPADWSLQFDWLAGRTEKIDDYDIYLCAPDPDPDPEAEPIADDAVIWQLMKGQAATAPSDLLGTWIKLTPNWTGNTGPLTPGQTISFGFNDQAVFDEPEVETDLSAYTMLAISYLHVRYNPATGLDNFRLHSVNDAPDPNDPLMGDANLDGFVDDSDLSLLLANWQTDADWGHGEFSGSNPVDDNDLSLLLANWTGSGSAGLTVPEPASASLLVLGALLAIRRHRR